MQATPVNPRAAPGGKRTKDCGSVSANLTMVFKLAQCAERSWKKLHGAKLLAEVIDARFVFVDGVRNDAAACLGALYEKSRSKLASVQNAPEALSQGAYLLAHFAVVHSELEKRQAL